MAFQNLDVVNEEHVESGDLPPLIQWHRGDLKDQNEALKNGGFILPVSRYFGEAPGQPVTVTFGDGSTEECYAFKGLYIAVLGYRKDWFSGQGREARLVTTYTEGQQVWSRTQLWGVVKELGNQEFILTFSRSNSMGIEQALSDFKQVVLRPISAAVKKSIPMYCTWMPVMAGPQKKFDRGTYATPPKLAITNPGEKVLEKLFIPNENPDLVKKMAEAYPVVQEWAKGKGQQPEQQQPQEEPFFAPPEEPQMGSDSLTEQDIPW